MLTAKIPEKKTLSGFWGDIYSKNSKYIFFYFLYRKGLDIKMDLISFEGYENAKLPV